MTREETKKILEKELSKMIKLCDKIKEDMSKINLNSKIQSLVIELAFVSNCTEEEFDTLYQKLA